MSHRNIFKFRSVIPGKMNKMNHILGHLRRKENEAFNYKISDSKIQIKSPNKQMSKNKSNLSSREDSINAITKSLLSNRWAVAICGPQGVGKTTTAYAVANNQVVQEYFTDGVVWVGDLGNCELNYPSLIKIYKNLLSQLPLNDRGVDVPDFDNVLYVPSTDEERNESEKEARYQAREKMAQSLHNSKLLVCVDGINDSFELDLFDFRKSESSPSSIKVLATVDGMPKYPKKNVEIWKMRSLDPKETYRLFLNEMGHNDPKSNLYQIQKSDFVTRATQGLPFAVRALGYLLKDSCSSKDETKFDDQKYLQRIEKLLTENSNPREKLFIILSETLLQTSLKYNIDGIIVTRCFVAFVTVFSHCGKCYRPWIPMEPIRCLFKEVIEETQSPTQICYQSKGLIDAVINKLIHVGFLAKQEALDEDGYVCTFVQIQHDIYQEFGEKLLQVASENDCNIELTNRKLHTLLLRGLLKAKKNSSKSGAHHQISCYILRWQPFHLLEANEVSKVAKLLKTQSFTKKRIASFGFVEAAQLHVADCENLWNRLKKCRGGFLNRIYVYSSAYNEFARILLQKTKNGKKIKSIICNTENMKTAYQAMWILASSLFVNGCVDEAFELVEQTEPYNEKTRHLFLKIKNVKKDHIERNDYGDRKNKALNLIDIGLTFARSLKNIQAIQMIEVGLNDLTAHLGIDDLTVARTHVQIGDFYNGLGLHQDAIKKLKTAIPTLIENLDENDVEISRTLSIVADSYCNLNLNIKALEIYLSILPTVSSTYGSNSQQVVKLHVQVGKIFLAEKRYKKASVAFQEAQRLSKNKSYLLQINGLFWQAEKMKIESVTQ